MDITKYNRVLIFDVETTGLITKNQPKPHILQLCFIVYHVKKQKIEKIFNNYIRVDSNVAIDSFITNLTGINRDICNDKGVNIVFALEEFYNAYMCCDCIIAHNLDFDREMIRIEIERNCSDHFLNSLFHPKYKNIFYIEEYCTMKSNVDYCSLYFPNSTRKKYPKLSELYFKKFGKYPENQHDALGDVMACFACL
jgi:DNA polymerase III epsilon subunit-like protein